MNDQNFFDLAMKAIAGQASDAERTELEALLASQPELNAEFEQLRADVRAAKETLALVNATETTGAEMPAYARERLQTKVRQTLGRPKVAGPSQQEQKMMWKWWWILGLATGTAAIVLLLLPILTRPAGPMVQVAMLDTVGAVRGSDTNQVEILKQQWKSSDIQSFDNPALLENWVTNWPEGEKVAAKVIYDHAAGEVRVLLSRVGKPQQRTFVIEHDLASTLHEADNFIREQMR